MHRFRSALAPLALACTSLVLDASFAPCGAQIVQRNLYVTNGTVDATAIIGTTLYIGGSFSVVGPATADGSFTSVESVPRRFLAALDVVNGRPTSWDPNPDGYVSAMTSVDSTVFVGGAFINIGGSPRYYLAAVDATSGQVTAFDAGYIDSLHAVEIIGLAAYPGALYVGGYFVYIGGQPRNHLAELDEATGRATLWNPRAGYRVYCATRGGGRVYAGGLFTKIGGQPRQYLASVDAVTADATSWIPNVDLPPWAIWAGPDVVYAGGGFGLAGYVTALDAATGQSPRWRVDADGPVRTLAMTGGTLYVGGEFTHIGGVPRSYLAALDAATGQPTSWNVTLDGNVWSITASGSTIYVGGDFNNVQGQPQNHIAAITTTEVDVPGGRPAPRSLELAIAPNPVRNSARIRYQLPGPTAVSLTLYDLSGRRVAALEDEQMEAPGPHEVALDSRLLAAGMYFCRLDAGGASRTVKLLRVK